MSHHQPTKHVSLLSGIILGSALVAGTASGTNADVITVGPSTGAEPNPIQAAIEMASDGDEIRVAPGIYTGTDPEHVLDLMGKAITLRAIEGPGTTIIDGEGVRRGIICSSLESPSTVIDGFTIRNGRAEAGAGMLIVGSGPTILNCRFDANRNAERGGGLAVILGNPSLFKCRFTSNSAHLGGAIDLSNGGSAEIAHCTFERNTAFEGAGIHSYESGLQVRDSFFEENRAVLYGGAVHAFHNTNTEIRDCVFNGNGAVDSGGALYILWSRFLITECLFDANTTEDRGGAVALDVFCEGVVRNSTFTRNEARYGGGIHTNNILSLVAVNCRFTGNSTTSSGGASMEFYLNEARPVVINSEFCNEGGDPIRGYWTDGGGNSFGILCPNFCVTDLNNDRRIDGRDLNILFGAWSSDDPVADIDGDGIVDGADLNRLLEDWGSCGGKS